MHLDDGMQSKSSIVISDLMVTAFGSSLMLDVIDDGTVLATLIPSSDSM